MFMLAVDCSGAPLGTICVPDTSDTTNGESLENATTTVCSSLATKLYLPHVYIGIQAPDGKW